MTRKYILVGDMHVQTSNTNESKKLIDFILATAINKNIQDIVFTGDIFHTHSIIRGQVLKFWRDSLAMITKEKLNSIILVGNHDMINQKNPELGNSIDILADGNPNVTIINQATGHSGIAFMPYFHNREEFVMLANELATTCPTLICHQNFTQSLFGDMIDQNLLECEQILAGHVHSTHLSAGKTLYVGTPKWDSAIDAGEDKGIWIFDFDDNGRVINKEFLSTRSVVTPIDKMFLNEGEAEPELDPTARNYLEIKGQSAWVNKMKKKYKGLANIKAVYTDRLVKSKVENSVSFDGFISSFKPIEGISNSEIEEYLKNLEN